MDTHTAKPVRTGDQVEVDLTTLAFGGDAVGRYQDFAIFVPAGIPGERVLIRITQVKDHYATAEIVSVLKHSPERVAPICSVFEECGGCQWQHLSYPKQLATKRQFVADALERIGKLPGLTVQPTLPSPSPYAYRNKAMPVLSMRDGHFVTGIYEPRSHRLVPYPTCPIQADPINDLLQKVLAKIDRSGLTPYQEKKHDGFLRHLAVRRGLKTGETLLAFVTRSEVPEGLQHKPNLLPEDLGGILPRLARELMEEVPGLVGVLQNVNPSRTNVVFGPLTKVLAGRDHYFEGIDGLRLKVSLPSFLQVNTAQADLLHATVREALGEPAGRKKWGTVLDLYSGIGTLSLAVASCADYVVGAEEIGPAVEDARENAKLNQKENVDFLEGDVSRILSGLKEKGLSQVDAVILDPPRKGVLPEVLARVAAFYPERIVYVSCDPSTLARDLALLVKQGYKVDWAQPLDMFPQTYHVETVVKLTREAPLPPELSLQVGQTPLEPFRLPREKDQPSLNITANLEAFRERTTQLGQALGGQFSAGAQLLRSLGAYAGHLLTLPFRWLGQGLLVLGRSLVLVLSTLGKALRDGSTTFLVFVGEGLYRAWRGTLFLGRTLGDLLKKRIRPTSPTPEAAFPPAAPPSIPVASKDPMADLEALLRDTSAPLPIQGTAPAQEPPVVFPALQRRWFFLESRRRLVWAFGLLLLLGGGIVAKATLTETPKSAVVVPSVSQTVPDVITVMPKRNYLRYELVPFEVQVSRQEQTYFHRMDATVEVFRAGKSVAMPDGRAKLRLRKDPANGKFVGNWPIPYNPPPGTYVAQVVVTGPQWAAPRSFESAFTIAPLSPKGLYPGYSALTMEGGKQLIQGAVPSLDGSEGTNAAHAIEWAKFMGANLYCYLIGQTSVWDTFQPRNFPFNRGEVQTGKRYAKLAHEAGLRFAGYLTTFKVIGDAWDQVPYDFALEYDEATDRAVPSRFISLDDVRRHKDIVALLQELDQDPNIDMVGLDYVRTGFGGFELVDEFVKDMSVPGPANFWSLPKSERIDWLARTVDRKLNRDVVELFEWWRAHKVALTLKKILDEAQMGKPVFTFTLGWQMGHQHGQDPAMFVDAGVDYSHIMLYEGDRAILESMKKQWPDYLSRANGMYALGEMVDFNWVQRSIDPAGPDELYRRQVEIFRNWYPVNAHVGMFWHDLYRIIYGIRGPYSSIEWAVAGGKSFSELQRAQGVNPLEVVLRAPARASGGTPVPLSAEVYNHSPYDLRGVVLHQLDTTRNYMADLATVGPFDLPAGTMVRVKSLYTTLPREEHPERDDRFMSAVMAEVLGSPHRSFDFTYLKKIQSSPEAGQVSGPSHGTEGNKDDGT